MKKYTKIYIYDFLIKFDKVLYQLDIIINQLFMGDLIKLIKYNKKTLSSCGSLISTIYDVLIKLIKTFPHYYMRSARICVQRAYEITLSTLSNACRSLLIQGYSVIMFFYDVVSTLSNKSQSTDNQLTKLYQNFINFPGDYWQSFCGEISFCW